MPNQDLIDLTEDTSPLITNLLYTVRDPAGSPLDRKLTLDNLLTALKISRLLAYKQYRPSSDTTLGTTSATFVDVDATNLVVTFTVPLSGKVLVRLTAYCNSGGAGQDYWWSLRESTTDIANAGGAAIAQTSPLTISLAFTVEGLTPGVSKTWKWSHARAISGTGRIICGPGGLFTPPAIMEIYSVP